MPYVLVCVSPRSLKRVTVLWLCCLHTLHYVKSFTLFQSPLFPRSPILWHSATMLTLVFLSLILARKRAHFKSGFVLQSQNYRIVPFSELSCWLGVFSQTHHSTPGNLLLSMSPVSQIVSWPWMREVCNNICTSYLSWCPVLSSLKEKPLK